MSVGFPSGPKFGPKFGARMGPKFAPKPPSKLAEKRGQKIGHVPGSMYKRFRLTTGQKMNRRAVEAQVDQIAIAGAVMFSAQIDQSYGRTVLALQQMARAQVDHLLNKRA